jgi:hypothetical protein
VAGGDTQRVANVLHTSSTGKVHVSPHGRYDSFWWWLVQSYRFGGPAVLAGSQARKKEGTGSRQHTTHTHTHTLTHTHTHTHTYTHIHTHTHTNKQTHTHTHTRTQTCVTHTNTHSHTRTYTHTHIHSYTHVRTHTLTDPHIHTHTFLLTYTQVGLATWWAEGQPVFHAKSKAKQLRSSPRLPLKVETVDDELISASESSDGGKETSELATQLEVNPKCFAQHNLNARPLR